MTVRWRNGAAQFNTSGERVAAVVDPAFCEERSREGRPAEVKKWATPDDVKRWGV
jgi:hypothetical protein